MAAKKGRGAEDIELNMTPMIDVVFNLIIFFMIVTDMTQKELEQLVLPASLEAIEDEADEDEKRVIINIAKTQTWDTDDSVTIKIRAQEFDLDGLKEEMFKHAEVKRDLEHPNAPSEIYVLIRCDKDIRWREVQWVMQACADPAVRIYKLQFATAKLKDDE